MMKLAIWPESPDHDELLRWEALLGRRLMYRERGGRGKLDTQLLKRPEDFLGRAGTFDLQSRVGTGESGTLRPVPFQDIIDGLYDDVLEQYAVQMAALGPDFKHYIEFQSECNVVSPQQPGPTWNTGGPEALRYVYGFWREVIARKLVKIGVSVTSSIFRNGTQAQYLAQPLADRTCDFVGVDGYSHPATDISRSFEELFAPAMTYAVSKGVPWAICECGTEEDPDDPAYKANWFTESLTWLKSLPKASRPKWVCYTQDEEWNAGTSAASLNAFRAVASSRVWR